MISKKKNKNKVVLGLSGGVDSTAAALLLQEKGYEVIGLYFDIKKNDKEGRRKAETAANQLGIEFVYANVCENFEAEVVHNFCSEYMKARTPNPCIVCNPTVKFKTLLDAADNLGAYYIATGHYANTYYDENKDIWYVKKAENEKKDQSYMLYRLNREAISRLLLPLNDIEDKEQVRQIARDKAMKNSDDKDSQEICFIEKDDNYKEFLLRRGYNVAYGDFVDRDGKVLGEHKGILNYTIGQRKGLGIALGKPAFVTAIDSESNRVVLGENEDLFKTEVISSGNVMHDEEYGSVKAKIRYAAKPADATIELMADGRIKTVFELPQRAPTPGQSIVFYRDDLVIGGGFID